MTDDLSRRLVELDRELADVHAQLEEMSAPEPLSSRRNLLASPPRRPSAPPEPASPHEAGSGSGDPAILGQLNVADAVTTFQNNAAFSNISVRVRS